MDQEQKNIETKKKKTIPIQDWVNNWLFTHNAKLDVKTGMVYLGDDPNPFDLLVSTMVMDADRQGMRDISGKINHALNVWKPTQIKKLQNEIRTKISFDANINDDAINRFILAVTGKEQNRIDIAVMKHFVWQIKRKLSAKKVYHHMMPIFFGPTDAGKTEAIRKFLKPIYEIYKSPQDMTVIKDERSSRVLFDCYCIFFDEMAKAKTVDVNRLKNTISSEDISYRPMQTNTVTTLINNATFIGATNTTLIETIYDPTSMRRFWQIDTLKKLNWDEINSIPYLDIWRSVDPEKESPINEYWNEIKKIQHNEYRNMFPLEEYLTHFCEPIPEEQYSDWWKDTEVYGNFKTWLEWQNLGKFTPTLSKFQNAFKYFKIRKEGETVTYDFNGKMYKKKRSKDGVRYNVKPNQNSF